MDCAPLKMLRGHAKERTLFLGDHEYVHVRRPSVGHPLRSRPGRELHGLASWLVGDKFKICQIFQIFSDSFFFNFFTCIYWCCEVRKCVRGVD